MKRKVYAAVFAVALVLSLPVSARAAELLIPVGRIIGLQLRDDTVTVAAFDDVFGGHARDSGLCIGDQILKINGKTIACAGDVREALGTGTEPVAITVRREGRTKNLHMTPAQTDEGPRLGVYLRQGIAGIGTVTWYDPDTGKFGTLGHGVSDGSGRLLPMREGTAFLAQVQSVKKGKSGEPGQLKGTAEALETCGRLLRNTPQGVFGVNKAGWPGEPLPAAEYADVEIGPAKILSTVQGDSPREYSVEILKIYPKDRPDNRNLLLKVTDPALLETTGGIVQGMGVSYNKDNQDNSLACRGVWCQSRFSLTNEN